MRYQTRMTTITEVIEKSSRKSSKINNKSSKNNNETLENLSKSVLEPQEAPRHPQDPPTPKTGSTFITPPGTILEGFWSHVGSKTHSKAIQKAHKILIDLEVHLSSIFHRFWPGLERIWEPTWPPKSM